MYLSKRIEDIDAMVSDADQVIHELPPELLDAARELSDRFDLNIGTLTRRAAAIACLEQTDGVQIKERHLQEAAQHLILRA